MILADVFYRYAADAALATVNRRHFRRFVFSQTTKNEYRRVLLSLPDNQSASFKGRAAQQTEHREAMTKQEGSRQIKLACI